MGIFDKRCSGAQDCGELHHGGLLQRWSPDLTLSTWDRYQPIRHMWQSQLKAFILLLSVRWLGLQVLTNCCLACLIFPRSLTFPHPDHLSSFFYYLSIPLPVLYGSGWLRGDGCKDLEMLTEVWALEAWVAGGTITRHIRLSPHLSS